jgi:hypothetical protein
LHHARAFWQVLAEHGRGGFVEGGGRGALAGKLKKSSKWKVVQKAAKAGSADDAGEQSIFRQAAAEAAEAAAAAEAAEKEKDVKGCSRRWWARLGRTVLSVLLSARFLISALFFLSALAIALFRAVATADENAAPNRASRDPNKLALARHPTPHTNTLLAAPRSSVRWQAGGCGAWWALPPSTGSSSSRCCCCGTRAATAASRRAAHPLALASRRGASWLFFSPSYLALLLSFAGSVGDRARSVAQGARRGSRGAQGGAALAARGADWRGGGAARGGVGQVT